MRIAVLRSSAASLVLSFLMSMAGLGLPASTALAAPISSPEGATPTITGATGLVRISSAEPTGTRDALLAVFAEGSRSENLLVSGDTDTRAVLHVSAAIAPIKNLQIFGALSSWWNDEQHAAASGASEQAFTGALTAGAKLTSHVGGLTALGGELGVELPARVSSLPDGTSAWLNLLCSVDLNARFRLPLKSHLNVGYYWDNSWKRYDFSPLAASEQQILMFAQGVSGSRVRAALAIEAIAYERAAQVKIMPFGEYHYEFVPLPLGGVFVDQSESGQTLQWLTVGTRVRLRRGVTLSLSLDISLESVGVSYGPPLPPFNVVAGASLPIGW